MIQKKEIQTGRYGNEVLKEGYYLDNFTSLIDFVAFRYHDLLTDDEKSFIEGFLLLTTDARRLFVRLIMRKGPYFNVRKLSYEEINIEVAIKELGSNDFILQNPRVETDYAFQVFTKDEILTVFTDFFEGKKTSISKDYLVFDLIEELGEETIWKTIEAYTDLIVPRHQDKIAVFKLLFFGNLRQGMEEFIFEDIGLMKFEKYAIRQEDRFFDNRDVVDSYFVISDIQYSFWEIKTANLVDEALQLGLAIKRNEFPSKMKRKLEQIYLNIGQLLEKNKKYEEALFFLAMSSINPARERIVRILDKQEKYKDAFELCFSLLDSPNYYEKEFADFYIEKIKKNQGVEYKKNKRKTYKTEVISVPNNSDERVEDAVLNYYRNLGWVGYHSESIIWSSLTGLILWDIIFKARANVFFNPFQRGPVDLFSPIFYQENRVEVDEKIDEFANNKNWKTTLKEKYQSKFRTANHLVNWKRFSENDLTTILDAVDLKTILQIAKRIIINPIEFKSGLPDLLLINPVENTYLLTEVKGPGDQLQSNQRRWLNYFEENDIPYLVQKVKWE